MALVFLGGLFDLHPADLSAAPPGLRAQLDTVGFAVTWQDMESLVTAARSAEGETVNTQRQELGLAPETPWVAAVMPHDDYLYAGRTDVHLLPGLQAPRWLVIGVCHACRRLGVKDHLIFDGFGAWRVAGVSFPVDLELRSQLLAGLTSSEAGADDERHAAEHSVESLLPWLGVAVPGVTFVPLLVPGMDWQRLQELADRLAAVLAEVCRERGWLPGRDLGILVSADAVHYGCEGWSGGAGSGYYPFGCDAEGHAAAVAQDMTLAQATLAGNLTDEGLARFARLVWDPARPEYPYKITWCGLYSIPFGLAVAQRLQAALGEPLLTGCLLRYGDSVGDGRLEVPDTRLGVTAPNTLQHWVGYPALGYVATEPATP